MRIISTHTPVWGVTVVPLKLPPTLQHFNSHARVGRDAELLRKALFVIVFQLTRPCGA